MLAVIQAPSTTPSSPIQLVPEIRSVSFSASTIRSGRVAVAKIDCEGVLPEEITCESTSHGFDLQTLPARARQGRFIIIGIRIHRRLGAPRSLCLVRFRAGPLTASASVAVVA